MELRDRYLQAVSFWLPRERRADITAELREDLRSEIDDKEAELGRPLTESEQTAILTRWGHPMVVAGRHVPPKYLIGPFLVPAYLLVLRLIGLIYLLPWALVWLGLTLFDPARQTSSAVFAALGSFWLQAVHLFALVTIAFIAVERHQTRTKAWERWTADQLTDAHPERNPREIPRTESLVALVTELIVVWWWVRLIDAPHVYRLGDGVFEIAIHPLEPLFYWPIVMLVGASALLSAANLARPWWTRPRGYVRLTLDLSGLAIACVLLLSGSPVEVTSDVRPGAFATARWANASWYITLGVIAIASAASGLKSALHLWGRRPPKGWTMGLIAGK